VSAFEELVSGTLVLIQASELRPRRHFGRFGGPEVPGQIQPFESIEDVGQVFRSRAGRIDVIDPQRYPGIVLGGQTMNEGEVDEVSDMQETARRRRETGQHIRTVGH